MGTKLAKKRKRERLTFEVGKFYTHTAGRQIAVLGKVNTYKWGESFVIEEADPTGHGMSVAEVNEFSDITKLGWIEIGQEEWLRNFDLPSCCLCGLKFTEGQADKVVPTDRGLAHSKCFGDLVRESEPVTFRTGVEPPIIVQ